MAIFIKDENYKQLSKIFLKDLDDYNKICKVYVCTGLNQYELLFDGCPDVFCDGSEDGECSNCKIRWLSIYDDLLLGTDGPTPEGITKIICPEETCNSGNGLKTTCLDDDICCDCEVEVPIPLNYEKCEPLIDLSCPCLQLDQVHCTNLPSYLNNTCKVYAWTALGGVLQEDGTCDSCSRPERTETAQCCINGRRYTYIKKVVWNNNPIDSSNCGIKKTCSLALFDNLISSEGGVAKDGPIIYNCPGAPSNTGCEVCEPACCADDGCGIQGCDTLEDWCRNWGCNPAHRERCEVYNLEVRQKSVCEICQGFMTENDDPCDCLPDPPCPQTPDNPECADCASCTNDPCNFICATYCDNIDICAEICGPPPDFLCAFGVVGSNYLDLMEQCGCAPPSNACDDICFS